MFKIENYSDEIMIQYDTDSEEEKIKEIREKISTLLSYVIWELTELKEDTKISFEKIEEARQVLELLKEKYDIKEEVDEIKNQIDKLTVLKRAWQAFKENIKNKNNIIDIGEIVYIERKEV
jgi:flagellin-specific chaperone FliS